MGRPLVRSSSSSSLFNFSDGSSSPLIRPIHQSGPPAVPPRGDQFHYLPQRPTFFRYASHSAQTPASGFFNPRPIVFDQGSQTSPVWRNPDRQGPRHTGPLEDHQQPSGAVQSPYPGYSRSTMAGPSPFRPVARGRTLSSSRPVRPFATSSSGSPPPTVFTVSPSQSEPHSPPPPFEASRPRSGRRQQRLLRLLRRLQRLSLIRGGVGHRCGLQSRLWRALRLPVRRARRQALRRGPHLERRLRHTPPWCRGQSRLHPGPRLQAASTRVGRLPRQRRQLHCLALVWLILRYNLNLCPFVPLFLAESCILLCSPFFLRPFCLSIFSFITNRVSFFV